MVQAVADPETRYGASDLFSGDRTRALFPLAAHSQGVGGFDSPDLAAVWGIGRFTQMDPIRGNRPSEHYRYARNNPAQYTDPTGEDIAVARGGFRDDNPFGHVGLGITGEGTFSYYTDTPVGSSFIDYLKTQVTKRDLTVVIIKTDRKQDLAARYRFEAWLKRHPKWEEHKNCATVSHLALDAAGIPGLPPLSWLARTALVVAAWPLPVPDIDINWFPGSVLERAKEHQKDAKEFHFKQGELKDADIPKELKAFEPVPPKPEEKEMREAAKKEQEAAEEKECK